MDSFFASVEVRHASSLAGRPGVVSTCSNEARRLGVHSGMPISQAYALCPHGVLPPGEPPLYSRVSDEIMVTLRGYADRFEHVSIDEFLIP